MELLDFEVDVTKYNVHINAAGESNVALLGINLPKGHRLFGVRYSNVLDGGNNPGILAAVSPVMHHEGSSFPVDAFPYREVDFTFIFMQVSPGGEQIQGFLGLWLIKDD